jgi:hypothetical protein
MHLHKAKSKTDLHCLLNAAIPMICHPKSVHMVNALRLMGALHIRKHLREKHILMKVAEPTLHLVQDAQRHAMENAAGRQEMKRVQERAAAQEGGREGVQEETQGQLDTEEGTPLGRGDQKGIGRQEHGGSDGLHTHTTPSSLEVVEWMSAPTSLATKYVGHSADHKTALAKLAKIVLPTMCGYTDPTAQTRLLIRLGVGQEKVACMLEVDQAQADKLDRVVLIVQLRPKLEPQLAAKRLQWTRDVMPVLEAVDSMEELKAMVADPAALLEQVTEKQRETQVISFVADGGTHIAEDHDQRLRRLSTEAIKTDIEL